jgi:CheY-like chemotaxis protein
VALSRGKALVVDDERVNWMLLKAMLVKESYDVVVAENGAQAVQAFARELPDIVFMDVMMPEVDGYEATRQIKALTGEQFVPVIFLTALNDDASLAKCVEVGGDDFLTKPYKQTLLRAKVAAMERIRNLYRTVQDQHEQLRGLHSQMLRDQEIAEKVMARAVTARNVALDKINVLLRPTATFNGDLLLTARHPSGDLHVLTGDFTGHGLAAAIGALPTAETFRAMTAKGFSAPEILKTVNNKLHHLLPTGMFMAATFITVSRDLLSAQVWNGGMPELLVLAKLGGIKHRVPSSHLPLGILERTESEFHGDWVAMDGGDRLFVYSDGMVEARLSNGELFGVERMENILNAGRADGAFARLTTALTRFCENAIPDDDITIVDIPWHEDLIELQRQEASGKPVAAGADRSGDWRWEIELRAQSLRTVDPVPLAISQLEHIAQINAHRQQLYTILSELYNNALDHGVLELQSKLKHSPEGFAEYYATRESKLMTLAIGSVKLEIIQAPTADGGSLSICLTDSGAGFDYEKILADATVNTTNNAGFSGRGVPLVKSLCFSLRYHGCGNSVEAVYAWKND